MSEVKLELNMTVIDVYGQEGKVVGILPKQGKALVQYKIENEYNQKWREIQSLLITEEQ